MRIDRHDDMQTEIKGNVDYCSQGHYLHEYLKFDNVYMSRGRRFCRVCYVAGGWCGAVNDNGAITVYCNRPTHSEGDHEFRAVREDNGGFVTMVKWA
jgi:hypothetical protein